MPSEITMPQLSDTMTEGTVVKWLKKEGDKVKEGEIIAEVETDKATMEWEATDTGTIAHIVAKEGDKVQVGGTIAVLATGSEDPKQVKNDFQPRAEVRGSASETEADHNQTEETVTGAAQARQATSQRGGNGASTAVAERVKISPLARRIAEERGIDLSKIRGSGPDGRIVQGDILAATMEAPARAPKPAPSGAGSSAKPARKPVDLPSRIASGDKEVIPLNKMRQTIALRLQQSKQQIPHFYETIDVDAEAISSVREKLNKQLEREDVRLSISDFVNKAVASALVLHPACNAHFSAQKNEITRFGDVNLGIAVAVPDGLIVPVLRNIDQMGLKEIRQRSVDLADRARGGKLKQDELTGATFTVSTLGMYGIRDFSAIINPPEVCILAISAAEKRAVVRDNQVVPRTMMTLTLSIDHRAVDGATAADFLRTLKNMLEEPGMMLV